mgnify:FL=1
MKSFKKNILNPDSNMSDAIKVLQECKHKIVLILKDNKLLGTITDGDIRRGLLNKFTLESSCCEIMNSQPNFALSSEETIIKKILSSHNYVPIVDSENNVVDVITEYDLKNDEKPDYHVVIMAGGKGKRLEPLTKETPKPLLPLKKKPIIHEIIDRLHQHNLTDIFISIYYKGSVIKDYFENTLRNKLKVKFIEEESPLGTAGSLSLLEKNILKSPIIVINGDVLTDINYSELINFHHKSSKSLTVCASFYDIQIPFGTIEMENDKMINISEKPLKKYLINAGIYVINPEIIKDLVHGERVDMTDIITASIDKESVGIFPMHEQWIDIGSHESYEKAKK